jgi:hypothetical protein
MDDSSGTPRIITPYVQSIGGLKIEQITQQTNPFGATTEAITPVGLSKSITIPISGFFDDTATVGPHVVFGTTSSTVAAVTRTLVVVTGGGTFTIEGHIPAYEVMPKNGNLTEYAATFVSSGVGAWT